ncbi:glycosyltransferase family 9 protein [Luteibacter sp. PPL552]
MGKRYTAPTGIHGIRRRWMRSLLHRLSPPVMARGERLPVLGVHRILVCRTSHSLGNTLLLTPLLAELERIYPGAEVDIVTQSPLGEALYGSWPSVRRILRLPSRFPPHLPWTLRVLRQMRAVTYDLAIDPDPQSKTGRLLLRMACATRKLGYVSAEKHGDVTHGVEVGTAARHVGQVPVFLLRAATGRRIDHAYPRADIRLDDEESAMGYGRLQRVLGRPDEGVAARPVIGVFANATGAKRLEQAWWFAMLDRLQALLPGHDIVEFIPMHGESILDDRFPALYSCNLRRFAACARHLDAFVSADCGPMHLAWSTGTPTFGVFVTTDRDEWGPFGDNGQVIDGGKHTPEDVAAMIARERGRAATERPVPTSAEAAHADGRTLSQARR